jgi:hypothetical protein
MQRRQFITLIGGAALALHRLCECRCPIRKTLGLYRRIVLYGTAVGNCDGDVSGLQIGGRGN